MNDPNIKRAEVLLDRIQYPIDLIELWKKFNDYRFDSPEYTEDPWWKIS